MREKMRKSTFSLMHLINRLKANEKSFKFYELKNTDVNEEQLSN